ncbi:MAG: nitroreductase family protein [Acidimicrobiales bacterium]
MELGEAIRRRRMIRDFSDQPVPPEMVDRLLDRARRAPSAGNTQGWSFLVLEGAGQTGRFWATGSEPDWLADPDLPGLLRAPVVVVPFCSTKAYLDRYSEPDKVAHGLTTADRWPAPFWTVDVSFATMLLLLGAVEEGLGALFFGLRCDPGRLRAEFSVPPEWEPIGAVALGWRSGGGGPVGSASRGRRSLAAVVHRGRW